MKKYDNKLRDYKAQYNTALNLKPVSNPLI